MKKIFSNILLSLSLASLSLPIMVNEMNTLSAAVVSAVSDESNVIDDLFTDESFKTDYLHGEYVIDSSKDEFDVLYVVESGYSKNHQDYDLVLYVRNISGKGFDVYNFENQYNSVEFYSFITYHAFSLDLTFINISSDHQFIKYRVKDVSEDTFINNETGRREYGIKGIEVAHFENNLQKFKEYPVAKKWNYEGNKDDLFISYNSSFEYLQLDLGSGAYPFGIWTELDFFSKPTHQQNLYYVYFNIPKSYQNSGSLYSIHADYYDFDLSNRVAFLVDSNDQDYYVDNYYAYDTLFKNGETYASSNSLNENKDNYIFHVYFDHYQNARTFNYELGDLSKTFHVGTMTDIYSVNPPLYYWSWEYNYSSTEFLNQYQILIPISTPYEDASGHLVSDHFDRLTAERVSGQSSSEVYKEIHYCNPGTGRDDSDAIETGWDLISEASNHWSIWSWWHNASESINVSELKCIEHIDYNDKEISNSSFKEKYYINDNDIDLVQDTLSITDDTYVFRFKLAESSSIDLCYGQGTTTRRNAFFPDYVGEANPVGYVASHYEGVVDFDVLDLTFVNDDDELETLPVVSDPVNVFPDVASPISSRNGGCSGFSSILWILLVVLLILGILLLIKYILPTLSNFRLASATRQSRRIEKQRLKVEEERLKLEHSKLRKQRKGGSRYVSRPKRGKTKYKKKKRW